MPQVLPPSAAAQLHPSVAIATSLSVPAAIPMKWMSSVDIAISRRKTPLMASASRASSPATVALLVHLTCEPLIDLVNWEWPLDWEVYLDDEYVDGTCGIGDLLSVAPVEVPNFNVTDGSFVRALFNPTNKTLPINSDFHYAGDYHDLLSKQWFIRGMRFHWHNF